MATPHPVHFGSRRLPALDGLRGVATLMVLFVHSTFSMGSDYGMQELRPHFVAGRMGVPLFFVISAFCLYGTYTSLTLRNPQTASYAFWIKRLCRIVPLWWIWVAIYAYWNAQPLRQTVASAFFYWGFARYGYFHDVFPGGWTLFVEETFYLLFPLLFPFLRSLPRLVLGTAVLVLVSIFWATYASTLGVPNGHEYITYSPINYWFCFFIGMACYKLFSDPAHRQVIANVSARYAKIIAVVFVAAWFEWSTISHRGASLLFAALLLVACSGTNTMSRMLSFEPLCWLGRRCYSMYLCHFFILDYFAPKTIVPWSALLGLPPAIEIRLLVWFPLVLGASALVSALTFVLIEKPSINLGSWLCEQLEARARGKGTPRDPRLGLDGI